MTRKCLTFIVVMMYCSSLFATAQELIWSDEFDGPKGSLPDETLWNFEIGDNAGWGNGEQQYYMKRTENVSLDGNGHLQIVARQAEEGLSCYYGPCLYTSARLTTQGKFEFTYGRIEARLRVPNGQGIWPAFWMLGIPEGYVKWPDTGEIDIVELIGKEPKTAYSHVHGPGYSGSNGVGGSYAIKRDPANTFHVFALEWQPNELRWYVDKELYYTLTPEMLPRGAPWVFDHDFFLLLNVAVGGNWPGSPDETTRFPQVLIADYIRVYELPAHD